MEFLKNYKLEGDFLKIYTYPSSILKKIANPVENFDEELLTLCKNMLFTMYKAPGIGLAAPQVGLSMRMFVMDSDFTRKKKTKADGSVEYEYMDLNPQVFINPVFKKMSGEILFEEGCLSIPGVYEKVKRYNAVTIEYFDLVGQRHTLKASESLSVCLQHENDHLDGIIFLERLSMLKKNMLTKKFLKDKKKQRNN